MSATLRAQVQAPAGSPMAGKVLGQPGDRVRLIRFAVSPGGWDDNRLIPSGTEGVITHIDGMNTRCMAWDTGHHLSLLIDADEWEVIT